ncbi:hypothetical protein WG66_005824 [Moniliophthora roreri]|nr:hypothetical protein WG66_005824 [Moniliophthora roreri]
MCMRSEDGWRKLDDIVTAQEILARYLYLSNNRGRFGPGKASMRPPKCVPRSRDTLISHSDMEHPGRPSFILAITQESNTHHRL